MYQHKILLKNAFPHLMKFKNNSFQEYVVYMIKGGGEDKVKSQKY